MPSQLIVIAAALGIGGVLFAGTYLVGMRLKWAWVQQPLIWLTRVYINPRQMRTAGSRGAHASVIRARGRVSGTMRATPVGVVASDDGFLVALPYGTRPQWLQNVMASGAASITHEGATYAVDRPEIVPMQLVERHFSPGDQRTHRRFGVDQCLRLRASDEQEAGHRLVS